ncbi:GNAT family N-acetyltransferase [Clostridium amazonitimonense]|uniref:GNAT family N-acetyltransferase n=1 Tax=Clostridium amazonitimonense TaxID=1499689 RepID=UPI000509AC19|nr:GNAT family protein [Clostridium amazonitimonense]
MINKKCFDIFPVLETERLILRQINSKDRQAIFEIYGDAKVAEYDWFSPIDREEKAITFIEHFNKEFEAQEEITFGIVRKEDGAFIGCCCLGDFDDDASRSEIGYVLKRREWNKGYATESVKALVTFGFETMDLNRIEAFITPGNDASIAVLKKAGFIQEGIVRERDLIKGKLEDGVILAILKRDYLSNHIL